MSILDTWLAQLQSGALSSSALRVAVRDALAGGALERAALDAWLGSAQAQAILPSELASELAQLSAALAAERAADAGSTAVRRTQAPPSPGEPLGTFTLGSGALIDRRYQLITQLGSGGFGTVFQALDQELLKQGDPDPYVAIKILNPALQNDPRFPLFVAMLQREATRAMRISHPNIVRIHYFGQDRDAGLYFICMELLEGRSLATVMGKHPAGQSWEEIARYLEQACAGLSYAHEQGDLVHSDIKPQNLFITQGGQVKILDFGIAAPITGLRSDGRTLVDPRQLGAFTPEYASTEMLQGIDAHASDDVYSLACVTYQWLTGSHPYARATQAGTSVSSLGALTAGLTPAPVRELTRSQNRALLKALALRRSERTQTIREFWDSMRAVRPTDLPLGRIAAVATAVLLAGSLVLLGLRFLAARGPVTGNTAQAAAAPVTQAPSSPLPQDTQPGAAEQPAAGAHPEPAVIAGCPGPATRATLDAALNLGIKAQVGLALHREGSREYRQAQASLQAATHCLRELARFGVTSSYSVKFLREAESTQTP
jgi:serine/threonine protein kinase